MNWENVLKADFSFRDVIKNSRGIYANIFDRIQLTPELSRLAGNLLGVASQKTKDLDISVAKKRQLMEIVLSEPLLLGVKMFTEPKYEKQIEELRKNAISSVLVNDDDDDGEEIPESTMEAIAELGKELFKEVVTKMETFASAELERQLGKEIPTEDKEQLRTVFKEVVQTDEFYSYTPVILSAVVTKLIKQSIEMDLEEGDEVEVNPDEDFPPSFYERESTMKSWFDSVKR